MMPRWHLIELAGSVIADGWFVLQVVLEVGPNDEESHASQVRFHVQGLSQ